MPKRTQSKKHEDEGEIKRPRGEDKPTEENVPANARPSSSSSQQPFSAEHQRLSEDGQAWRQWGPYLSERQWGTVREDKSEDGNCWDYVSHDDAAYRAYTSGEDGLLGICDDQARLCLALSLWNGADARLKERLFGLTGSQGNHAEDVKEVYFYLDSTPTHSYMRALYKYPQLCFPYEKLVTENAARTLNDTEYEILDTGVFDEKLYWDVVVEYAKNGPNDILCQYTVHNRGPNSAELHLIPTLWCRNVWSEDKNNCDSAKPVLKIDGLSNQVLCSGIEALGEYVFVTDVSQAKILFTNNETNVQKLKKAEKEDNCNEDGSVSKECGRHFKDSFHDYIIHGDNSAVNLQQGTKCAFHYSVTVNAGSTAQMRCRLFRSDCRPFRFFGKSFDNIINQRIKEADGFYNSVIPQSLTAEEKLIVRQAYSGLCWSKQFYCFDGRKIPEDSKKEIRNLNWRHMRCSDVISMPDTWEFPWFAPWDLAFQVIPFADVDLEFSKSQLLLLLTDRYQHPNGQLPGCEFNFDDANPPVQAWACLTLSRKSGAGSEEKSTDLDFLQKCFHGLDKNFNWWLNEKDTHGRHLFSAGFLGMDNISAIDRSLPPDGTTIEQADGTAWVAFYARCMMEIALELSARDPVYENMAISYLRQFVSIAEALNSPESGLWDSEDSFFYDRLNYSIDQSSQILRIRSLVGLVSLFSAVLLRPHLYEHLDGFKDELQKASTRLKRIQAAEDKTCTDGFNSLKDRGYLLSLIDYNQLKSLLHYLFDEREFLAPFGIRSLSKFYNENEFSIEIFEETYKLSYCTDDSNSDMFGGNSNWRGPVWLCMNYLLLEALDVYSNHFGDTVLFEFPSGSQTRCPLRKAVHDIRQRLISIFLPGANKRRPLNGKNDIFAQDPHWQGMIHYYEFYNADTGRGLGASHQTGWSALVASILQQVASVRQNC